MPTIISTIKLKEKTTKSSNLSLPQLDELIQYTPYVFQKKTFTHIIGYKLKNSCLILIIFYDKIPHII